MSTFLNNPLNTGNLATASGSLYMQIATNYYNAYTGYYGGKVISHGEHVLLLAGFMKYLNSLTGLGSISPAVPPSIVSGSWAAANALSGSGYF